MKKRVALPIFAFAASHLLCTAADRLKVTISRTGTEIRTAETIAIPFSVITAHFPNASIDHLQVSTIVSGTNDKIPYQVMNFEPEEHRDNYRDLIFQHDFAAGETQAEFWVEQTSETVPPFTNLVSARYIPERFDDFAWENDRIGHRAYGPGLNTPAAGKTQMISSGIDVWCKRVRYPIVDRWYRKGHYHEDSGEGLDMYDVGGSRGTGGTAVWDGQALHTSGNWKSWRVLANGPIRAVFELSYGPWEAGPGVQVSEVKRFTVDAGHNLDQIEDTYTFSGAEELTIAAGIAIHTKVQSSVSKGRNGQWIAQWEMYPQNGDIGEAIVLPHGTPAAGYADSPTDHLILFKVKSGLAVRYFAGAGWDRSGDFKDEKSWYDYVTRTFEASSEVIHLTYSQ